MKKSLLLLSILFSIYSYGQDTIRIKFKNYGLPSGLQWTVSGNNIYNNLPGSVGIGTTNMNDTNFKLFVETGIRTRKVKVDQSAWPDYVFSSDYSLLPLKDLETYIQENNHLPDVPSAKEVKMEGLDLGNSQAVLLKKVEELTLYLLRQNEEIEKLKKMNEEQNKKIKDLSKSLDESVKED